jgi:hypothetical protein
MAVYNVREHGATGNQGDSAQAAIQQAIALTNVAGAQTFLRVAGEETRDIPMWGNDTRATGAPLSVDAAVPAGAVERAGPARLQA